MSQIDSGDEYIDSRDVCERIEELESLEAASDEGLDEDDAEELAQLLELAEQGENIEDWNFGATLIRETYWSDHVREMASDYGWVADDSFISHYIDWEKLEDDLLADYTHVTFDGVTFYAR